MQTWSFVLMCIGMGSLWGCVKSPDYILPKTDMPDQYKEQKGIWKVAAPQEDKDRGSWWLIFDDAELNELETEASMSNQNIAVAHHQYEQALAIVRGAKSSFFPTLLGSLEETKSRPPANVSSGTSSSGLSSQSSTGSATVASLQASWEPDVWGNVRRLVDADEAFADASLAQVAAIKLSIQATLARTYFQLRALDEIQDVLDDSIQAYEKFLHLTKNQYRAGIASQLQIFQAETQLEAIRAQAIDNGIARSQYEHAIAVLLGRPPAHFSIKKQKKSFNMPLIPSSVPSTLLERRPDIAKAERLMAQANAQLGIAKTAFFPVITLSGSRGINRQSFGQLFSYPIHLWSLGAQIAGTLLDGGARYAAIDAAEATYQATVAQYRQTILTAFQEVEDNLASLYTLEKERKTQDDMVGLAKKQMAFIKHGHEAGTASSLEVLSALYNIYMAQRNVLLTASRQMVSAVSLVVALGGDWHKASLEEVKKASSS